MISATAELYGGTSDVTPATPQEDAEARPELEEMSGDLFDKNKAYDFLEAWYNSGEDDYNREDEDDDQDA